MEDMKCVHPRDALSSLCSDPTPLLSWSCPVSNTENESTENKILVYSFGHLGKLSHLRLSPPLGPPLS